MSGSFSIKFYLNRKKEKGEQFKIYGRLIHDRKKCEFTTNYYIEENKWDEGRGSDKRNQVINDELSDLETQINRIRQILQSTHLDLPSQSINYMRENINKPLKLVVLAASTGYSTSHFSRIFSERTGHAPMEYFNQLKKQEACRRLHTTKLSVDEIVSNLGYSDPFYFSRTFK